MKLRTRKLLDKSFSALGVFAILVMATALVILLSPIIKRGIGAFVFKGTVEYRKLMFDKWKRGNEEELKRDIELTQKARQPVYDKIATFRKELKHMSFSKRMKYKKELKRLEKAIAMLLGPTPGKQVPLLMRKQYGQTRWERVAVKKHDILYKMSWDYSNPTGDGVKVFTPRKKEFAGTSLESLFPYIDKNCKEMLRPKLTFYYQFLTDKSYDSHFFGGIWPELLGTIYLTIGAMIFAIPIGILAAIYFCEYAKQGRTISFLRVCISTLAGVPSIVFGLFGLAFFINTIHISSSKSVVAGALTLALLILPTIIRSAEEAILSVPRTYKEASLALGASRWRTVVTIILPAALPGILTGIVISMGRAAGETAPIIFTAAVSVGKALRLDQVFSEATPALPWNIYNLCTEHEAVNEIRHVQYGMVFSLIAVVLILNISAIIVRARVAKKLKG